MSTQRRLLLAFFLWLPVTAPAGWAAAAEPPAEEPVAEAAPADVERVIETLEDPEARAELVRELKVLLEARRAEAAEDAVPRAGDLLEALRDAAERVWAAITGIDPLQLLTSVTLSLVILVTALLARWGVLWLLRRMYGRLIHGGRAPAEEVMAVAEIGAREPAAPESGPGETPPPGEPPELPPTVVRLINLIIGVLTVALIAESWGAGVGELLRTGLGARVVEAALSIGLILVITLLAWHVAGLVVARLLTLAGGRRDRERTARRLDTLVPLLRSVLQGVIGVLAALLILSELGVDIGPLLAGAGILGLAVGIGAQSLVKDIITGVSILLEDGASLGDVVEAAGHTGVVEEMRVRVMQLRDLAGAVHLIPYSEVTTVINYTKDFSFYLMEVGVAYREDTDEVCAVLNDVCDDMRSEPLYAFDILEPLEILGVDKFADSAVIIKCRLKTRPGRQWAVGREFNRRMKKQFDQRGIEIPFPHTTVYFGEPKQGEAPPARLAITRAPTGEK